MTVPDRQSAAGIPKVAIWYDPAVDPTDDLRDTLSEMGGLEVDGWHRLGAGGPSAGIDAAIVVAGRADAADRAPDPPVPTVWLTDSDDVAAVAYDRDPLDVFAWVPGDDPDLLERKLRHTLADAGAGGDGTAPSLDEDGDGADDRGPEGSGDDAGRPQRVGDGVIALNDEFVVTFVSDAAATVFAGESPVGDVVWDHLSSEVRLQVEPALQRALAEGERTTARVRTPGRDGTVTVTAYPSEEGLLVYTRDPGRRTGADTGVSLYEQLVETVGDAIYLVDDQGRFTYVNDALCEMTGYDRGELLGSSVHIIKDDETVAEAEAALGELLSDRKHDREGETNIAKLDVELITKAGERIPCTDRMTLRPPTGDELFTGTVGTLRDVSRQRRRQNILSGLLDASREMLSATTTEGVAEMVVETAEDVLDIDMVAVREYDPETDRLVPVATSDRVEEILSERPTYGADEGPVGTAFQEGRLVVDTELDHLGEDPPASAGAYLPIGDRRTLTLGRVSRSGFTDDERQFVELLARTAASVFDRVEREEELRRYEAVLTAAEDTLFTVDEDGEFTLVSGPFARLLGTDRSSLVGRHIDEVLDDDAVVDAVAAGVDATTVHETTLLTEDGDRLPARLTLSPIEGDPGGEVVGTAMDLSELQDARREASRQRARFTELFETLSDPVADVEYGEDGATVRGVNEAFARLCDWSGGPSEAGPSPRSFDELLGDLPPAVAEAIEPAGRPGTALEEEVAVGEVGSASYYLLRTVPYEADDARRAFVILTDVTDVRERETHLKVVHRLLRHNLRNKTTVITGWAGEIADTAAEGRIVDHAERVLEASRSLVDASRTAQTIQRVLGMDDDAVESVPVGEFVESVERIVDDVAGADGRLVVDVDGTVTHSEHLPLAVEELVENAVEHTEPGTPVEVSIRNADDGGVTVAVADEGPGLPESKWRIVTGDREVTQLQHIEGLGLWLVRWVVDRHDGRLSLDVVDGEGTAVEITLPR